MMTSSAMSSLDPGSGSGSGVRALGHTVERFHQQQDRKQVRVRGRRPALSPPEPDRWTNT